MPSVSRDQQQAAGMALSAKRGNMDPSELKGSARKMYDSMSEDQLKDFAETKHKGLPDKIQEMNELLNITPKREVFVPREMKLVRVKKLPDVDGGNIFEAKYRFSKGQKIEYRKKNWTVVKSTSDWVEIADKRGFNKLIDFKDIKSFNKGLLKIESYSKNITSLNDRINLGESGPIPKVAAGMKLLRVTNPKVELAIGIFVIMRKVIIETLKLKNKHFKRGRSGNLVIPLDCDIALEFMVNRKQNKVVIKILIGEPIPRKGIPLHQVGKACITVARGFKERYNGKPIEDTVTNPTFWSDIKKLKKHVSYERPWTAKEPSGTE